MIRQTTLHSIVKSEQPIIRRRKPLRLKEYDYSLASTYFVTICTKDRIHLFGEIINGEMQCNNIGEIARCNRQNVQISGNNHLPSKRIRRFSMAAWIF